MFCGSDKLRANKYRRRIYWENLKFSYLYCRKCRGYSLSPILEEHQLAKLYSLDYEVINATPGSTYADYLVNHGYTFSISYLKTRLRPGTLICDFGCGTDSTLREVSISLGAKYIGVEYDQSVVDKLLRENPENIYLTPAQFAQTNMLFDYIFIGDVLEHVSSPSDILITIKKRLKPEGEILIQGPLENSLSLLHLLIKVKSLAIRGKITSQSPYHVSLASRKSILRLFARNNLQTCHFQTFEVPWPVLSKSRAKSSDFSRILYFAKKVDLVFQKYSKSFGNRFFAAVKLQDFNS